MEIVSSGILYAFLNDGSLLVCVGLPGYIYIPTIMRCGPIEIIANFRPSLIIAFLLRAYIYVCVL